MNDTREDEVEEVLAKERAGSGNYTYEEPVTTPGMLSASPPWNRYLFHEGRLDGRQ